MIHGCYFLCGEQRSQSLRDPGGNGRKSCWSGEVVGLEKKKKKKTEKASEAMTKTSERELEIGNTPAPAAPLLTLQDRDSEQHTDSSFSIPPPQVGWSTRRGGGRRRKLYSVLFWLCSTVPLILNSKCGHLKNPNLLFIGLIVKHVGGKCLRSLPKRHLVITKLRDRVARFQSDTVVYSITLFLKK